MCGERHLPMLALLMGVPAQWLQIIDFLEGVAKEHGEVTGVTNLIGNMCIKPAHLTSDEEVWFWQSPLVAWPYIL